MPAISCGVCSTGELRRESRFLLGPIGCLGAMIAAAFGLGACIVAFGLIMSMVRPLPGNDGVAAGSWVIGAVITAIGFAIGRALAVRRFELVCSTCGAATRVR